MKRLIAISSCLFVIVAGAASAWASCEQASFFQSSLPPAAHAHDHPSDSHHKHEHKTVIHCPTLDAFVLTATFSQSKNDRVERIVIADVSELADQFGACQLYRSLHGPPGYSRFGSTPPYLVFSVLLI